MKAQIYYGRGILARVWAEEDCKNVADEEERKKCVARRYLKYFRW